MGDPRVYGSRTSQGALESAGQVILKMVVIDVQHAFGSLQKSRGQEPAPKHKFDIASRCPPFDPVTAVTQGSSTRGPLSGACTVITVNGSSVNYPDLRTLTIAWDSDIDSMDPAVFK